MERGLIPHYDNPAKRFLRGYRAMMIRRESLLREINRRRESANLSSGEVLIVIGCIGESFSFICRNTAASMRASCTGSCRELGKR